MRVLLLSTMLALTWPARTFGEPQIMALLDDGSAVIFAADAPSKARPLPLRGVSGKLIGIDQRPADGQVYGLANGADLYRINTTTGEATLVSTLTVPFDGDIRSGFDFNPQADRLRLVSIDGRNLRVNVALGATAVDTPLAYAPGDANAGRRPRITASAYANNRQGAATTILFEIDAELGILVKQDPPNDGLLHTVGPLGVTVGPLAGFDIITDRDGHDRSFLAAEHTLYTVDLANGAATVSGDLSGLGRAVVSLTVLASPAGP